jgi:RHS repeat-associated protein
LDLPHGLPLFLFAVPSSVAQDDRSATTLKIFSQGVPMRRGSTETNVKNTLQKVLAAAILCLSQVGLAQSPPYPGIQPFSTNVLGVDLATSAINQQIPLRSKVGKLSFWSHLEATSLMTIETSNKQKIWCCGLGFSYHDPTNTGMSVLDYSQDVACGGGYTTTYWEPIVYDNTGAPHWLGLTWKSGTGSCVTASASATDPTGITLAITNGNPSIYDPSGNRVSGTCDVNGCKLTPQVTDPDGASITFNPTTRNITDTLGAIALTGSYPNFSYVDAGGSTQNFTMVYGTLNIKTVFGCPGVQEVNWPSALMPVEYDTPQGNYYFAYESVGGGWFSPRLGKMTFPSGGSLSYAYSGGNNDSGIDCESLVVPTLAATVDDNNGNVGTWTYVNSNTSSTAGNFTVSETDPAGNKTVDSFAGEYQTQAVYYQGTSTVLKTVTTCYGSNGSAPPTPPNCAAPSTVPTLPITETDVYTSLNTSATNRVKTTFDSYGNATSIVAYDFGATTPTMQTYTSYGQSWNGSSCTAYFSGTNIYNTPCYTHTENSSGTDLAGTKVLYNNDGTPSSVSRWTGATENTWLTRSFGYGANGAAAGVLSSVMGPNGAITTFNSFSCNGMVPAGTTYPLSSVGSDSQAWDCNGGVVTSRTDVNGKRTTFAHSDPLYRLTQITYPDSNSHVDTFAYHTGTNYPWYTYWTKAATASTSLTGYSYVDGLGRPTTNETDGYGWQATTYNNLGQVYTVSNPYVCNGSNCSPADPTYGLTTYTYDALGRVKQVSNPDGSAVNSTYTNRAVQVSGIYGLNRIYQYDGLGRMLYVCDGINSPTQFGTNATVSACNLDIAANGFEESLVYDALSNLKTISYSGQTRSFAYDGLSRRTSAAYPETGTTTYSYDNTPGQLYQATDARNKVTTYAYDAMNRVTGITFNDSSYSPITYGYDQSSLWGNPLTNGKGRLTTGYVQTSGGTVQAEKGLSYDSMGRVIDTYSCAPLSCGHSTTHLGYTYDFRGDRLSLYDGDNGLTIGYTHDTIGDLTSITSSLSNAVYPATLVSGFTYNALRLPTQDSRADGVTETYSYDQMGRMLTYDAGSLYTLSLVYNTAGDVKSATDSINGTWTYDYYSTMMHKLSWAGCSANCSNGWANFAFAYDQYGNRWQQVPSGNGGGPLYTFTSSNQISTSDGMSYNASGDIIADGLGNTYSYDAFHRVYNISGNTVAAFTYDAFGDRVNENPGQSGSNLDLVFDGGKILHRNNSTSGNGWGMEIQAGKHIGFYNDHFYFNYQDQVGSTRMMTQYTNTGSTVVETCPDLAFGDWASCSGTMPGKDWFRFADFLVDADGEAVSQTRRLSTVQGRWSSPDPAGLAAMDLTNPQTLNLYSYVENDPLSLVDPFGLDSCPPAQSDNCVDVVATAPSVPTFTINLGGIFSSNPYAYNGARGNSVLGFVKHLHWPKIKDALKYSADRSRCAANNAISMASDLNVSQSSFLGQSLLGNDAATVTNLVLGPGKTDAAMQLSVSNPTPVNLVSITTQAVVQAAPVETGGLVLAQNGAGTYYASRSAMTTFGQTASGQLLGLGLKIASVGKVFYDSAMFIDALIVCSEDPNLK